MLGSLSEADDAVQEAWLRLSRSEVSGIENLGGWLTTAVAKVYLKMLRSRNSRREEPLGVHVPDPVVSRVDAASRSAGASVPASERRPTRSSRPPATATSPRSSRCSTRTSCCGPMARSHDRALDLPVWAD